MTPTEIALVREGFERIAPDAENVGLAFYQRLFALDPSLRPMFADDLRPQVGHLMTALTMVVRSLDDLGPVLGQVKLLGSRHGGYGVKPEHFGTVGAALLGTLEAGLGDGFTADARAAWTAAYTTLAGAMIASMAEDSAASA